ncbi:MAG TPA: Gfo/Idh/MocA family oxidoreductase [Tepidisphaeraceae bacterium]|jgi:predicted dehydrogenase|nr:Gfo/Idh/MocA family oxidoreductase [Tepidisphaeraceae bacterium]
MIQPITRWGIVGTGYAKEFAKAMAALPDAKVIAVASRFQASADAFGHQFGVPHCYDSVAALARDPDVDAVYIASAPQFHAEHALELIGQGKAVLVEKPFTINADEAKAVIALAKEKGVFCMEGLWSRFLPAARVMAGWLAEGQIGDVRQVIADFGFCTEWDPEKRHFSMERRGGCLLDVGCYSLAFATMALGLGPIGISAQGTLCATGVDEQAAMVLKYPRGGLAVLSCANRTRTPHRGCIIGTEGQIHVEQFTWAHGATLLRNGQEPLTVEPKLPLPASCYQANETMRCLRLGLTESPLLPSSEVIERMEVMDEIRRQIGLVYPGESVCPLAPGPRIG